MAGRVSRRVRPEQEDVLDVQTRSAGGFRASRDRRGRDLQVLGHAVLRRHQEDVRSLGHRVERERHRAAGRVAEADRAGQRHGPVLQQPLRMADQYHGAPHVVHGNRLRQYRRGVTRIRRRQRGKVDIRTGAHNYYAPLLVNGLIYIYI